MFLWQQINPVDQGPGVNGFLAISELKSPKPKDISLKENPDVQIYLPYDFYYIDNPEYHFPGLYGIDDCE